MSEKTAPAPFRGLVVACLVVAAGLSIVWVELQPPFPDEPAARLAAIDEAGTGAAVSAVVFTASQLPWLVAVLGIAWLTHRGAPRLSVVGGALAVLGGFGHAVFGGAMLVTVLMSWDVADREVHAGTLTAIESSPMLMSFAAAGLLGTVLGLVLLGAALWRSRVVPRWVPSVLWAFLVVEFAGSPLSDYSNHVAGLCLLVAFGALAQHVWRGEDPAAAHRDPAPLAA